MASTAKSTLPHAVITITGNVLSSDGSRIFFQTTGALVPQDNNGKPDVYVCNDTVEHVSGYTPIMVV